MLIVLDILCPDRNDNTRTEQKAPESKREEKIDRERMTRVQVINIHGHIVDVEH